VPGLTSASPYYFFVEAVNSAGAGLASNEASAIPTGAPAVPTNFAARSGDEQVSASWSKPGNDGGSAITGYTLLWRKATSTSANQVSVGAAVTNDTVNSLDNGTAYQFAVEAVNASGAGPATPWAAATPTTSSPPLAPTDLTAAVKLAPTFSVGRVLGEIDLSWDKPAPGGCPDKPADGCTVQGYSLSYYAEVSRTNAQGQTLYFYIPQTATFAADATSGSVSSFLNLDSDTFELFAVNQFGQSAGVQVTATLEVPPGAPHVAAAPGAGQVTLSWTEAFSTSEEPSIGPVTYSVYYGTSVYNEAQPPSAQLNLQSTSQTYQGTTRTYFTATVSGLASLTKYYFKVIATDAAGSGPPSSSVGATTFAQAGAQKH
jgi:Fibronectin type III domain